MALRTAEAVETAVIQHDGLSKQGLLERAFAFAFRGLVYAQIWEDPVVDMEALAITPDCHVVTIASGGCNVLSYLTADPRKITAVDLNTAHIALNRLKLCAAQHLPDYASFRRFFGDADSADNIAAYRQHIAPHLDETSRRYWEGRDLAGRRRIGMFQHGAYKRGLLGGFIGAAHLVAKLYRIDPRLILEARTMEEQRAVFDAKFAPLFNRKFIRWLTDQPASLFGLGIPPAQYDALAGEQKMAAVLRQRLERLACDYDLKQNYFAWQAFGRGYGKGPDAPLPPYLTQGNYAAVTGRADRVDVTHANMTDWLAAKPDASLDRYILLDAQDWMTDAQLTALWTQIVRTARPGARVLFRTAAEPSLLPGRIPDDLLNRWDYRKAESLDFTRRDRSSIYGGVHLYTLKD
jgi:S-adenosylmethionine-diacylglycerol 3-amino-3-carboxypropyl transferase